MLYRFSELVDIQKLQNLHDSIYEITGIGTAILEPDGTVLVASGWKRICAEFHRKHPETLARCKKSDTFLAAQVKKNNTYSTYKCLNGLVDVAMPIHLEGEHIASLGHSALYQIRKRMGMLFQNGALLTDMNVFDNLAFPLREHTGL